MTILGCCQVLIKFDNTSVHQDPFILITRRLKCTWGTTHGSSERRRERHNLDSLVRDWCASKRIKAREM